MKDSNNDTTRYVLKVLRARGNEDDPFSWKTFGSYITLKDAEEVFESLLKNPMLCKLVILRSRKILTLEVMKEEITDENY